MKVLLLDDEKLALDYLEHQLSKIPGVEISGRFMDPRLFCEHVLHHEVDVVFIDIMLPEINGIELAERLLESKPHLHVVFCTAYDEYAVKAFELNALDYLMKPVSEKRLRQTFDRISVALQKRDETALSDDVQLNLFQHLTIKMGDKQMHLQWRTAKAQELFLYLLQHRGKLIHKSALIELLWPELEMDKAFSQLYTTVYLVRRTLKPFYPRFQLVNKMEGYMLHLKEVRIDVEEWEKMVVGSSPVSSQTIVQLEQAMKRYTGEYLSDYDYWWAESERFRLSALWVKTVENMAAWHASNDNFDQAEKLYLSICQRYPQIEGTYFALMQLYASRKMNLSVHQQFRRLETMMEELNESPSLYIREWYEQWKQDNIKR